MTPLKILREEIHDKCLDFRALDRLVQTPEFEAALAADPHNVWVRFAIQSGNVSVVEGWVRSTLKRSIGVDEMSIRDLRAKASELGIRYYNLKTKDELVVLITQVTNDRRAEKAAV